MTTESPGLEAEHAMGVIDQAPDAMILADTEGTIRIWNGAATRVFGFAREVALGASVDIIIPERFRDAHWRGFHRAVADRETKYAGQALPTRATRDDGTQIYVELSFSIVADRDGRVRGALAHARDITERFERERADRKRIEELEKALAEK
jgi:PAS domain S-box-containing protein